MLFVLFLGVTAPLCAQVVPLRTEMKSVNVVLQEKGTARVMPSSDSRVDPDNWQSRVAYKGYGSTVSPLPLRTSSARIYNSYAGGSELMEVGAEKHFQHTQLPSYYTAQKLNLMTPMAGQRSGDGRPDPNPEPNPDPTPISDIPWVMMLVLLGTYMLYRNR